MRAGAILVLCALGVGLVTGTVGYMRIARLLVSCVIIGGALALALFASVRILWAVAAFGLRVWPLRLLHMVHHHRELLDRRIHRVLIWLAVAGWLARVLDYLGLFEPTMSFASSLLAVKLERGSIHVTLEDILAFVLAVWAAYLLSAFIRFVLQEDVYPRRKVPQGMAYAASRLLHYIILALGFVVGMGVLGVDLTKVTVLVGAFGVGLGFGLQSVVNNFVSGLILLFERPVHVGDTVEVGNLQARVQKIGIRSSVVRTLNGAEIIVPNSQLVSEQVTNWTLSDQLRRIDLPVGVSYSAAPQKVIEVLEAAAAAHPRVLKNPPPRALFVEYGDSSINFELRAWTDDFDGWYQVKSDLAVTIFDAVHAAGMSFPFPQREVRLLQDDEA
jgi:potassium efflux system protein